jgi:alpha-tubulin suppressor-like RCC1 family protein
MVVRRRDLLGCLFLGMAILVAAPAVTEAGPIVKLSAGSDHTCAVTSGGGVVCWGANYLGQLGDGTTTDRRTPVAVQGLTGVIKAIALGEAHTCALTAAGEVFCWGNIVDPSGNLSPRTEPRVVTGLGGGVTAIAAGASQTCAITSGGGVGCWSTTFTATPVSSLTNVTAIAVGASHGCAVAGGGAWCWGQNHAGQLGDGTTSDRSTPVAVAGLQSGVASLAAGPEHTCALTTGGAVSCWGANYWWQLGNGGVGSEQHTPVPVTGLQSGVTAIASTSIRNFLVHTCAVVSGGVRCWGVNSSAQLGDGTTTNRSTPVEVNGLPTGVTAVAPGDSHTCALSAGDVWCWGSNSFGKVGDGSPTNRTTPVATIGPAAPITGLEAGHAHTCAVSGGNVSCWGSNFGGQLGDGTRTNRFTPVNVSGVPGAISMLAAGETHTCALTADGAVWCWGAPPATFPSPPPDPPAVVPSLSTGVVAIAAGSNHTCAIGRTGTVSCWGANSNGQLGDGTTTARSTPVAVTGLPGAVSAVALGVSHSCALTTAGSVWCWGYNFYGQLGDGTSTDRLTPAPVSTLPSGITAITAGSNHSCALSSGGGAWCWGWGIYGQLGDEQGLSRTAPVQVSGLPSGVTRIVAGHRDHTCAVTGGTVSCWGGNAFGQLGDGTTTNRLAPAAVAGLSGISAVAAGYSHTCALQNQDRVWCWGKNENGQLGEGDTSTGYKLAPLRVQLPALTNNATSIGASTATINVTVTADGGVTVTARGVCWGTTANPGLAGTCTSTGTGTGTFSVNLTGLSAQVLYHARGYVTNGQGTFFAEEVTFITGTGNPTMAVDRTSLAFSAVSSGTAFTAQTPEQPVHLTQTGPGSLSWTATTTVPWLMVSPPSGSGPARLTISARFVSGLTSSQTGSVQLTFTGASNTAASVAVTLTVASNTAPASLPFGTLDTPAGGTTALAGSVPVTGWALDNIGVQRVELWRDLQPGETTPPFASTPSDPRHGKIFVAVPSFVDGARPDVEGLYPNTPLNYRAGWGYLMLTWGLWNQGNGTYQLHAYALDQENNLASIGSKSIVVSNATATKPFGSIDTPSLGGLASGVNYGWGLTPKVNGAATCRIPSSGVQYSIDSGPLQPVVYGDTNRTDVAAAFPGFSNSTAAGGHAVIDWSLLAPGPHTIGWVITDDCGRSDGVGSRFFSVANSQMQSAVTPPASALAQSEDPVTVARGFGELPEIVTPGQAGSRTIDVRQGERIELRFPRGFDTAYQLVSGGESRALPIGATWDPAGGTFSWQPAPGFLGRYRLVFSDGRERINLRVVVRP